jgi:uncharacterized protein
MDGAFETEGRNPATGATVLVLALGSIYFLVQSVVLNGYIVVDLLIRDRSLTQSPYSTYKALILSVLAITQYVILLAVPALVIRRWHTHNLVDYLRLRRAAPLGVLLGVVGILALLPPAELIARWLYSRFPGLQELTRGTEELVRAESPAELLGILFVIAVTPALCEEFLFRAYFQRTVQRRLRYPWHFLLSGVLFALFHQQLLTLPSLVLVGLYLSFMYWAFGSPWVTAAAHFAYNGVQVVLANVTVDAPLLWTDQGFTPLAVVAGTGVTGLVLWLSGRLRAGRHGAGRPRATPAR